MRYRDIVTEAHYFRGLYVAALLTEESAVALNWFVSDLGVPNAVAADQMHFTIIGTKGYMQWDPASHIAEPVKPLRWEVWTPSTGRCLVLRVESPFLKKRFDLAMTRGANPKHKTFNPHVTISYKLGAWKVPPDMPLPDMPLMLDHEYAKRFDANFTASSNKAL